jgi:O-antigen/teichoic acid export membrane protein
LPSYRHARSLWPVIAFGLRFQAVSITGLVREQGLNVAIATLSGVGTLGLWTLAKRLLEIPSLIFEPLHRVAFPYMSQVRAAREDPGPLIERGMRVSATAAGVVLTGLAASAAGLVPGLFGQQWSESAVAVQWVCASLLLAAPLAVVAVGFLYAAGEPAVVLRATVLHTLTLFAVAFPLLPYAGVTAIGVGSLTGALVDALVIGRAVGRLSSARPFRLLGTPFLIAVPAAVGGAAVTSALGNGLVGGVAGGCVGAGGYLVGSFAFRREASLDTVSLALRSIRDGLARGSVPPAPVAG